MTREPTSAGTPQLPDALELVRTTDEWDQDTTPDGLLRTHRVADGVWGRLIVTAGGLDLTFEDDGTVHRVTSGGSIVLPPGRPHHVTLAGPVRFAVEFHREV